MDLYTFFESLSQLSGMNEKLHLVSSRPRFAEEIFHYTLNPYKNYWVKKVNIIGMGDKTIGLETFQLLDDLNNRKLVGNAARDAVQRHAAELTVHHADLFSMIISRKLRVGLGIKSLNKVLLKKIPVHEVMLAYDILKGTIQYPCWVSPKLDGMRGGFRGHSMLTRTGKPVKGISHITDVLDNIGIDTDGELLIPGKTFQESLGRLRSHADVPEAVYYVFDTPDTMKAFEDRLDILKALQGTSKSIRVIKHELVRNEQELLSYYQKCRAAGLEGVVVKRMGHLYVGTRSRDWLKMKDVLSADAPIVSFKEGEGKYEGTLGAIVVKLRNGLLCDVGTGFTDKERDEIWENKINYLGRVVEVMYHERTNDGNLRHPRMSRFRPDK